MNKIQSIENLIGEQGLFCDGDWIETNDQDPCGSIRLIQLADIGDGIFLNRSKRFINEKTSLRLRCTLLMPGDVLIARMPDPIGRACVFPDIGQPAITAVDVCILRVDTSVVDPHWIASCINSPDMRKTISTLAQGATRLRVPTGKLRKIEIAVPPIETQRLIAKSLKKQFSDVDKARCATQMQLDELVNLANAIIQQSVEHPNTDSANLSLVLNEVKKGIGISWADYPVLGATRAGLALAKEPVGKQPQKYKPVTPGTVFYNPMRILIGSIAFVDDDDPTGITSPDYVVLQGKPGVVDSRWFYHWLRSPLGERCILSLARGAVRERMLFNRLADGKIELPDYSTQQRASQALAELKPMRRAIEQTLKEINLLPERILAQAFES